MAKPSILDDIGDPYATNFVHIGMEAAEIGTPADIEPHLSRSFLWAELRLCGRVPWMAGFDAIEPSSGDRAKAYSGSLTGHLGRAPPV
jgi:hypothetical protein